MTGTVICLERSAENCLLSSEGLMGLFSVSWITPCLSPVIYRGVKSHTLLYCSFITDSLTIHNVEGVCLTSYESAIQIVYEANEGRNKFGHLPSSNVISCRFLHSWDSCWSMLIKACAFSSRCGSTVHQRVLSIWILFRSQYGV